MLHQTKAVIFDMDGVIIDSEPLWRIAMIKGFSNCGINFTEEDCVKTTGMRLNEVILFWQKLYPNEIKSVSALNQQILNNLIELIENSGKEQPGLNDLLINLKEQKIKIGLATSSDEILVDVILKRLNIKKYFDGIVSAQFLNYGKPHPEVYLKCAETLNLNPVECIAIEDSVNGIISAKAAQMFVIGMPDHTQTKNQRFLVADKLVSNLSEANSFIMKNIDVTLQSGV